MAEPTQAKPFGPTTSKLLPIFKRHSGGQESLKEHKIRPALNELGLFPTRAQIYEFVSFCCEVSGRSPVDHITYGEFCVIVTELRYQYQQAAPAPVPQSHRRQARGGIRHVHRKGPSVFLGGSCNPTTWRQDVAIPYLMEHGIVFFNPQVHEWRPELMELEDEAKQDAEFLFFVIDGQTRAIASMIESVYLGGCGRKLVLIVTDLEKDKMSGEPVSQEEIDDLVKSRVYLTDIVERQNVPVFNDINVALKCTVKMIQEHLHVNQLTSADGADPVQFGHCRVAAKLLKLREAFNSLNISRASRLSLKDASLAFKVATNEQLPTFVLDSIRDTHGAMISFEEFCIMVAEYRYRKFSTFQKFVNSFVSLPGRIFDLFSGRSARMAVRASSEPNIRDIYLGGTKGDSTWRQDIAIPELRKQGISYYNPVVMEWNRRYTSMETSLQEKCRLLLYVITAENGGIMSMMEAGYYIGRGCAMVLFIEKIEQGQMSKKAYKDYHRGRCYLSDIANREGVPVFDRLDEAIVCAITKIRGCN